MEAGDLESLFCDNAWSVVMYINNYAVLMGYLSMAIKGLGFLMLTWTTVVLLGGFVSILHPKDFWCLTFVTVIQTAGIFDVYMNEKLGYAKDAVYGLLMSVFCGVIGKRKSLWTYVPRLLLACLLVLVQAVVLAVILCPLAIIYLLGMLMSGGISLWRLIKHDDYSFSDSHGEASNLLPAMDTLYYLAVFQSLLFCYKFILSLVEQKLVKKLATNAWEMQVVSDYMCETRRGCEKDPSFAKGRNLVTYAIDKIGSSSLGDSIFGVKIFCTAIDLVKNTVSEEPRQFIGLGMLMKHLVLSAPSYRHILQKLLEMLNSRGIYDRERRQQATDIVLWFALNINLEDFPCGIEHISSLIGTFQEYSIAEPHLRDFLYDLYEEDWELHATPESPSTADTFEEYKDLLLSGLLILKKLALKENNCRVMSDTRDLVSKIMAPVTFDLLHHTTNEHGAWSDVVKESMEVMSRLASAPRETGAKLRRQISSSQKAISTLWRILSCDECEEELQQIAIRILTRVYTNTNESGRSVVLKKESSSSSSTSRSRSREDFVRQLVDIFTDDIYSTSIRGYAGGALSEIFFRGGISDATVVIQMSGDVVHSLTKVLVHDQDEICRQAAANILQHLCTHYTKDDEYLGTLQKEMTNVMPEVLGEIICWGDKTHKGEETNQHGLTKQKNDKENQYDNGLGNGVSSSSSHPLNDEKKVLGEMIPCRDETHKGIEAEQDWITEQKLGTENQCDNGRGKGVSSSSSDPQNHEKKVLGEIIPCGDKIQKGEEIEQEGITKQKFDIENQCDNGLGNGVSSSSSDPQNHEKKVLGEIIPCGDKTHKGKEIEQDGLTEQKFDIENQCDNGRGNGVSSSSSHPQNDEKKDMEETKLQAVAGSFMSVSLLSSLLSLLATVYQTRLISDLPAMLATSDFLNKLMRVVFQIEDRTVKNLLLCKAICNMVISMMDHVGATFTEHDFEIFIDVLSVVSEDMLNLDYSMIYHSSSSFGTTLPKIEKHTLASLVRRAKKMCKGRKEKCVESKKNV